MKGSHILERTRSKSLRFHLEEEEMNQSVCYILVVGFRRLQELGKTSFLEVRGI